MVLALPVRRRVPARAIGVVVAPLALLGLLAPLRAHQPGTTYASASQAAAELGFAAALLLIVAAGVVALTSTGQRSALLAAVAAMVWLAPDAIGWEGGPAVVRSIGELVRPLLPAVLLHMTAAQSRRRWPAWAAAAAYVAACGVSVLRAAVRDPLLDAHCWSNCTDNVFLLHADPQLADAVGTALAVIWATTAVATLAVAVPLLLEPSRLHRPYVAALALAAGGELAYAVLLLTRPEWPPLAGYVDVYLVRSALWAAVALTALWPSVHAARSRHRLRRVAADLQDAPGPGSLASALAARLGDPHLEVVYPLDDPARFVDGRGVRVPEPRAEPGRSITGLARGQRTIALIAHDAAAVPPGMLDEMLRPASRLSIENERLAAQLQAQVHDLQDSQARIVVSGDQARRRLERDLHDGAQQSLLALTYELRLARAHAGSELATVIDDALGEASLALDELRDLAHGIHPAVLTEAGLAVALRSLADGAAVPVELGDLPSVRLPDGIELAIFVLVTDLVGQASARAHDVVTVDVRMTDDAVLAVVSAGQGKVLNDDVVDRIGALGGSAALTPTGVRAEIPCG